MSNPSKAKGTKWETEVVNFLREHEGFELVERRTLSGSYDRGDIAGISNVVIECKNAKEIRLAKWADETEVERINDFAGLGVLVIKRSRQPIEKAYCVIPLEVLPDVITAYKAMFDGPSGIQ